MSAEVIVQYHDVSSRFRFPFTQFPQVTIGRLKQLVADRYAVEPGVRLRIFRRVRDEGVEELANRGTFSDFNIGKSNQLTASVEPLAVQQKNLNEAEMARTLQLYNWIPPRPTTISRLQKDAFEIFGSFGPVFRIIINSRTKKQDLFSAIITFETVEAAQKACTAMKSKKIVEALKSVTLLNQDIVVYYPLGDEPTDGGATAQGSSSSALEPDNEPANNISATGQEGNDEDVQDGVVDPYGKPAEAGDTATAADSPTSKDGYVVVESSGSDTDDRASPNLKSEQNEEDKEAASPAPAPAPATAAKVEAPAAGQTSSPKLRHALHIAKTNLIQGYLDGRQGVALLKWSAEPVPLRAKLGAPQGGNVSDRVANYVQDKAIVVKTRMQGAAQKTMQWFKRTTRKENMKAVKERMAATARVVRSDIALAAKKVATSAARAKDTVKARLQKSNSKMSTPVKQRPMPPTPPLEMDVPETTRSPEQEYFLKQAAEAAAAATAASSASSSPDGVPSAEPVAAEAEAPKHLTFDDI